MKTGRIIFFIIFFLNTSLIYAQFLIPGHGISDVKIGADRDEIEWELGFKGKKSMSSDVPAHLLKIAEYAGIDFDFLVSFNHLMWLPVTELLFKDGKVCMIRLSSIPEFNQMLSADIGTEEGLSFWDSAEQVEAIYKEHDKYADGLKTIFLVKAKGLGVELYDNEVRTMFIFSAK